ncbi:uncharacterized protein J4E88_008126 [Alternaria novae-zelandiae]|uniref:uncharacterized protein n=1 Tax=Alternaria novae-zelandiae TaxID=430562 RepID=UPI0020C542DE|nr:uncharacterized protein J4E88_008126 [Alternaria novae-zelandiae]KAI4674392.1 hypothetical protein J4E88_008126 [Alternaria novae-zelandiae]
MSTTTRVEEVYQEAGRAAMEQYHIRAIVSKKTRIDLKVIGDRLLQRTRVNYEDSVDMDHPVSVDQKANPEWNQDHFCWEAKGKCAQDYKEVETKLLRELDQSRRESFCEVGVSLFMIGKTPQKAKPVIIISSQDQRSRKEAKKAITRSGILEDLDFELGVLKYLPSGPIHPIAGSPSEASWDSASESGGWDSDTWETAKPALSHQSVTSLPLPAYYDPKQRLRITGMPLYVKTTDNQSRMGTANLVHNGSTYGYITAAHIFSPLRHAPPSIDDGEEDLGVPFDSDSDDEDNSEAKRSCAGSPISNPTKATKSQILDHGETKLSRFNGSKMPSDSSEATSISPPNLALLGHVAPEESELSMDYAIIAIENIELVQQLEHFSVSEGIQSARASAAAPKPSQATAWTTHGPTHDKALNQNTSHTMSNGNWVWDHRYQDYYCITLDAYQRPIYHWSKQQAQADIAEPLPRQDSGSRQNDGANVAQMPEPAPQDARALRGFIQGTPQTGWYDLLDQSKLPNEDWL